MERINMPTTVKYLKISEGKVSILGGHSIGHSKQKIIHVHVSCSELFPYIHTGSESVI
jgi:hypothetical protein